MPTKYCSRIGTNLIRFEFFELSVSEVERAPCTHSEAAKNIEPKTKFTFKDIFCLHTNTHRNTKKVIWVYMIRYKCLDISFSIPESQFVFSFEKNNSHRTKAPVFTCIQVTKHTQTLALQNIMRTRIQLVCLFRAHCVTPIRNDNWRII